MGTGSLTAAVILSRMTIDADSSVLLGVVPGATPLKQMDTQVGTRIRVQDPYTGAEAWVELRHPETGWEEQVHELQPASA